MKKNLIVVFIPLILLSCAGFQDAAKVLRNEKINSTDEFLVKKKEPLVLPPDYSKIPEPGSLSKKKEVKNEELNTINDDDIEIEIANNVIIKVKKNSVTTVLPKGTI